MFFRNGDITGSLLQCLAHMETRHQLANLSLKLFLCNESSYKLLPGEISRALAQDHCRDSIETG